MIPMGLQDLIDHSSAIEIRPLSLFEYFAGCIMYTKGTWFMPQELQQCSNISK